MCGHERGSPDEPRKQFWAHATNLGGTRRETGGTVRSDTRREHGWRATARARIRSTPNRSANGRS